MAAALDVRKARSLVAIAQGITSALLEEHGGELGERVEQVDDLLETVMELLEGVSDGR